MMTMARNCVRTRGCADPKKSREATGPGPDREVVAGESREIAREEEEVRGLICSEAHGHRCGYRPKCRAISRRTARARVQSVPRISPELKLRKRRRT